MKVENSKLIYTGYGLIFCAIMFLGIKLSRPKIKGKDDLYFITDQFEDYSFSDGLRGSHVYTFTLKNYSNSFQIRADYLDHFEKRKFQMLSYIDSITIAIAKRDISELNSTQDCLTVYSINDSTTTYLDLTKVIAEDNSSTIYVGCEIFFLLGGFLIFCGKTAENEEKELLKGKPEV